MKSTFEKALEGKIMGGGVFDYYTKEDVLYAKKKAKEKILDEIDEAIGGNFNIFEPEVTEGLGIAKQIIEKGL